MRGDTPQAIIRLYARCPKCGRETNYKTQYPLDQPQHTYICCEGDFCRHGFYVRYEPPGPEPDGDSQ